MSADWAAFGNAFLKAFLPMYMGALERNWQKEDRAQEIALQLQVMFKQREWQLEDEERARGYELMKIGITQGDPKGAILAATKWTDDKELHAYAGRAAAKIAEADALEKKGAFDEQTNEYVEKLEDQLINMYGKNDSQFWTTTYNAEGRLISGWNVCGTAFEADKCAPDQSSLWAAIKDRYRQEIQLDIGHLPADQQEIVWERILISDVPWAVEHQVSPETQALLDLRQGAEESGGDSKGFLGRLADGVAQFWEDLGKPGGLLNPVPGDLEPFERGEQPGGALPIGTDPVTGEDRVMQPSEIFRQDVMAREYNDSFRDQLSPDMEIPARRQGLDDVLDLQGRAFAPPMEQQPPIVTARSSRAAPQPPADRWPGTVWGDESVGVPTEAPFEQSGAGAATDLGPRAPTPPALHERPGEDAPMPGAGSTDALIQEAQRLAGETPAALHERPGEDAPFPAPVLSQPSPRIDLEGQAFAPQQAQGTPTPSLSQPPDQVAQPPPAPPVPPAIPSPGTGGPPPTGMGQFEEEPMLWDQPAAAQTATADMEMRPVGVPEASARRPQLSPAAQELPPPDQVAQPALTGAPELQQPGRAPTPLPDPGPLEELLRAPTDDVGGDTLRRAPAQQQYWGDESVGVPAEAPFEQPVADTAGDQPGTTLAVGDPEGTLRVLGALEGAEEEHRFYMDGDNPATFFGINSGWHTDPVTGEKLVFDSEQNAPSKEQAQRTAVSLIEPGSDFDRAVVAKFGDGITANERTALVISAYRHGGPRWAERIDEMPEFVQAVNNRDTDGVLRGFIALDGERRGKIEAAIFFQGYPPPDVDVDQWADDWAGSRQPLVAAVG